MRLIGQRLIQQAAIGSARVSSLVDIRQTKALHHMHQHPCAIKGYAGQPPLMSKWRAQALAGQLNGADHLVPRSAYWLGAAMRSNPPELIALLYLLMQSPVRRWSQPGTIS